MNLLIGFLRSIDRQAWIRFFVGLLGLAIAFLAALSSTVFREQGNLIGTAVAASFALLTAGFVGLYIVPYLVKRVAMERVRQAINYDITKEGAVYFAVILVIAVAALNTNNNLLFIVVAAMLAAVLISGVASALMLRFLRLRATFPDHVFAKQASMARLSLGNVGRLPAFSVSLIPPPLKKTNHLQWQKGTFVFPKNRPAHRQWLRLPDWGLERAGAVANNKEIINSKVYFPYVPGRSSSHADVELNFPRRGRYLQGTLGLSTRFPFSFLRKTKLIPMQREMIVYPSIDATDEFLQVLPTITGEFEAFVAGRGHDLYRIREHQPGDSARVVDWKATAKSGSLKVREFTREDERKLRVIFDNPQPGIVSPDAYERAVQLAASITWYFSGPNTELSFLSQGYDGSNDVTDFMRYLALVDAQPVDSILDRVPVSRDYNIVITAQRHGTLPTSLWASSYVLFIEREI